MRIASFHIGGQRIHIAVIDSLEIEEIRIEQTIGIN